MSEFTSERPRRSVRARNNNNQQNSRSSDSPSQGKKQSSGHGNSNGNISSGNGTTTTIKQKTKRPYHRRQINTKNDDSLSSANSNSNFSNNFSSCVSGHDSNVPLNWQKMSITENEKFSNLLDLEGATVHDDGILYMNNGSKLSPNGKTIFLFFSLFYFFIFYVRSLFKANQYIQNIFIWSQNQPGSHIILEELWNSLEKNILTTIQAQRCQLHISLI